MTNKVTEWCPHCETEVPLDPIYQLAQPCPNCGAMIKPCAMCDSDYVDCNECDKGMCQKWKIPNTKCCMRDGTSCMMCDHYKLCPLYKKATS